MQIDPASVKWDESPTQAPQSQIDPRAVQWDGPAVAASSATGNAASTPAPTSSTDERTPGGWAGVARQAGLAARYGIEGLSQAAEVVTEPLRKLVTDPVMRAVGAPEGKPLGQMAAGAADALGLPKPMNEMERIVGDASRFVAGGAGMAGAAGRVAQAVAPSVLQRTASTLASNPGSQLVGAAGSGAGVGLARENGGNEWMQLAAGLAGGLGASGMAQAARSGVASASAMLPVRAQQVEQAMARSGVDWTEVPANIQQAMRTEVERALRSGESLDAGALSRLLEFKQVGATPTRGTLSLDPVQITREQNLARMGANATDTGLHGLARVQNENNRALIESLNRLGAGQTDDAFSTGERMMGTLQRGLDTEKGGVNALYGQARDSSGRSFELDGHAFTTQASRLLDENLLGQALPPSVSQHLNRIAAGEVPFNVDYAEQLKTVMGKLQRASSDGQARMALGMVRQALDDTPVLGLNRAGAELGEQALEAFNRARLANREMMQRVERIPGLKAVYDGTASPDNFVQQFVLSRSAKTADTGRLAFELRRTDPQAYEAVRGSIAQHLKTAAIGAAADETGKFSSSNYNRAMLALGQRKLAQFFSKEEVAQLRAVGKVAQYTTVQPVGSAVNNSNSGAMLAGRGLDLLNGLSDKVPLMGIGPTVSGLTRSAQQRQAQSISAALTRKTQSTSQQSTRESRLTFGALMSSTEE